MNTWKVIFATLVIFITGVVTGGLLVSYADRASQKKRPLRPHEAVRPLANNPNQSPATNSRDSQSPRLPGLIQNRMPRAVGLEFLQKLDAEVHLTTGQHERIEQIIKDGQLRNKEILERITPELRREMAETQKSIREILTPEQHQRFEELMKQSRPAGRRNNEPTSPDRRPSDARDQRRPLPPKGENQTDGVRQPPSDNP